MTPTPLATTENHIRSALLSTTSTDSGGDKLPWNYDPAVLSALVLFLLASAALLVWNAYALHRSLSPHRVVKATSNQGSRSTTSSVPGTPTLITNAQPTTRSDARSRAPGGSWWTKARLAKLQLVAATMHFANQVDFLAIHLGRGMNCAWLGIMSSVLYAFIILPSSTVLILQTTMLVPAWRRPFKRTLLFMLVAVAMSLVAVSTVLLTWDHDIYAKTGVCVVQYDRKFNVFGKTALVCMYLVILLVLTLASGLGIFNLFDRFVEIEFAIQNVGMVCASTLALEPLRPGRSVSSASADAMSPLAGGDGGEGEPGVGGATTTERQRATLPLRIDLTASEAAAAVAKLMGSTTPPHAKRQPQRVSSILQFAGPVPLSVAPLLGGASRMPSTDFSSSTSATMVGNEVESGCPQLSTEDLRDNIDGRGGGAQIRRVASGVWINDGSSIVPASWANDELTVPLTQDGEHDRERLDLQASARETNPCSDLVMADGCTGKRPASTLAYAIEFYEPVNLLRFTMPPAMVMAARRARESFAESELPATDLTTTTSSAIRTLPWNYDPVVLAALVFFLLAAIALFAWNAYALHRLLVIRDQERKVAQSGPRLGALPAIVGSETSMATATSTVADVGARPTVLSDAKDRSPDAAAPWWTKVRLAKFQLFAATLHVANQIDFLVLHLGRDLSCLWLGALPGVFYVLILLPSSTVLILQTTVLVPAWQRPFRRAVLFVLVAVGMSLVAVSKAMLTWDADMLEEVGVCSIRYDRELNVFGKGTLVIVYVIILHVLVRPMVYHVLEMRKLHARPGIQRDEHSRRLEAAVMALLVKLVLVILLMTLAAILGMCGVFKRFVALEYTIQNTGTVCASTLALDRMRSRRFMDASGESASVMANDDSVETGFGDNSTELDAVVPTRSSGTRMPLRIDLSETEAAAAVAKLMARPNTLEKALSTQAVHFMGPVPLTVAPPTNAGATRVVSPDSSAATLTSSAPAFDDHQFPPRNGSIKDAVRSQRAVSGAEWANADVRAGEASSSLAGSGMVAQPGTFHQHHGYIQSAYSVRSGVPRSSVPTRYAACPVVEENVDCEDGEAETEARRVRRPLTKQVD
ncbi:hypothetical protein GGF31_002176 [Allomyces arbusculus]|nr:hypothetical protein GGF31_002176 [Allomyces arbusculus]